MGGFFLVDAWQFYRAKIRFGLICLAVCIMLRWFLGGVRLHHLLERL